MVTNHSGFSISDISSEVADLSYLCNVRNYSCHNKRKVLLFYNCINSLDIGYFPIHFDRYWYTRIEDVDK